MIRRKTAFSLNLKLSDPNIFTLEKLVATKTHSVHKASAVTRGGCGLGNDSGIVEQERADGFVFVVFTFVHGSLDFKGTIPYCRCLGHGRADKYVGVYGLALGLGAEG